MTPQQIEAMKLALEALDIAQGLLADARSYHQPKMLAAYTAIKEALAQPEQEPVCPACKAEVLYECVACSSNNYPPPQRTEPLIGCVNHDCAKCKEEDT